MKCRMLPLCYLNPNGEDKPTAGVSAVVIFDGRCHLCNGVVRFLLRHDRRRYFRFAARESRFARRRLSDLGLQDEDTAVLLERGRAFTRSTAALRILWQLGGVYGLAYGLILVPRPVRDAVYEWVARNRYRWFVPPPGCPVRVPVTGTPRGRFIRP